MADSENGGIGSSREVKVRWQKIKVELNWPRLIGEAFSVYQQVTNFCEDKEVCMNGPNKPLVFISYSRKDKAWLEELIKFLAAIKDDVWFDTRMELSSPWPEQINENLGSAKIIVLLVTQNFITSPFCMEKEVPFALEQRNNQVAKIIPLLFEESTYELTSFGKLPMLPKDGKPVQRWKKEERNTALKEIAKEIISKVNEAKRSTNPSPSLKPPDPEPNPKSENRPVNQWWFLTRFKAAITVTCILLVAVLGFWAWWHNWKPSTQVEQETPLSPTLTPSVTPAIKKVSLSYDLESDGKKGYRFVFNATESGYWYLIGPMDGKGQYVYLSNRSNKHPEPKMRLECNYRDSDTNFTFPKNEGFTDDPGQTRIYTVIWNRTPLGNSSHKFLSAVGNHPLKEKEIKELGDLRESSKSRQSETGKIEGKEVITGLSASDAPIVWDIPVRWPR